MEEDGECNRLLAIVAKQDFRERPRAEQAFAQDLFGHDRCVREPLVLGQLPDEGDDDGQISLSGLPDLKVRHKGEKIGARRVNSLF